MADIKTSGSPRVTTRAAATGSAAETEDQAIKAAVKRAIQGLNYIRTQTHDGTRSDFVHRYALGAAYATADAFLLAREDSPEFSALSEAFLELFAQSKNNRWAADTARWTEDQLYAKGRTDLLPAGGHQSSRTDQDESWYDTMPRNISLR